MTKFLHFNVAEQTRNLSQKLRKKYQSRTVAVDTLSADEIRSLAQDFVAGKSPVVRLNVGVTYCSFQENYCKASGRKEALAKQMGIDVAIGGVVVNDTHVFVQLVPYCGVQMNLRLNKSSGFSTITGQLSQE